MKDPRPFPERRDRVYLSPAHLDLHSGRRGFFVERLGSTFTLGYYDLDLGTEHARDIDPATYRALREQARRAAREFGESCGNLACEKAVREWADGTPAEEKV